MTGPALPGKRRGYGMAETTAKFKRGVAKPSSATETDIFLKTRKREYRLRRGLEDDFVPQHMAPPRSARASRRICKPRPAATPASISLILSPRIGHCVGSKARSEIASRIMPGLGLRHG